MKKLFITLTILLSLVLLYGCSPNIVLEKEATPRNVVLSSFRVHIGDFNQNTFYDGNYANLFLSIGRPSPFTADLGLVHQLFNKKQNQSVKHEIDSTYTIIGDKLSQDNLYLLPANTLKGMTEYDPYGYPVDAPLYKAFKKGNLALQVNIYLDEDDIMRTYNYPDDIQLFYTPRLTLDMKLVNSSGKTVWDQQSIAFANRNMMVDNWFAGGLNNITIEQAPSLANMVKRALNQILKKPGIHTA